MELVGQILKRNRKTKKFSLLDVSKELNISVEILENIENSNIEYHIDSVFIIGHLRSYCSFLDLNQNELINQFKKENLPKTNNKIEIERPKINNNLLFSNKIFSLSLILIILISFYFLFIEIDKPPREYALIPDLPENYLSVIERASLDNLKKNIDNSENKNFAEIESYSNSSSAIASLSKIEDPKSLLITLKFLDDTWLQIRDKNEEIIFSQLMNQNDEYSYDLDSNYSITSGNAGHILVLIDQKVRGKIGKKGQVVDSLILNKDFNN